MTFTQSGSQTFTIVNARELGSKVAADLRLMQRFYGKPSDAQISDYLEELVQLLVRGYLKSVDYGFKKDGKWVVALNYTVYGNNIIATNDNAGRVPIGANVTGATFGSYLEKSAAFHALQLAERDALEDSLPFKRSTGDAPTDGNGIWVTDRAYSSNGTAIQRRTFKPLT